MPPLYQNDIHTPQQCQNMDKCELMHTPGWLKYNVSPGGPIGPGGPGGPGGPREPTTGAPGGPRAPGVPGIPGSPGQGWSRKSVLTVCTLLDNFSDIQQSSYAFKNP